MRPIFYTFLFCLSCFFLIRSKATPALPRATSIERAGLLIQEYAYKDLSFRQLQNICGIANIIQAMPPEKKVTVFTVQSVQGSFYRNPNDNSVLFVPPSKSKCMIGRGHHKKVFRGLLFTHQHAEVVAACIGDDTILHEADILRVLSLGNTLFPYRTFFPISDTKYMLVLRFYNMGGLNAQYKKGVIFDLKQKLMIARDIAHGLALMHKKGIAHRDLHDGNILLHRTLDGTIQAGLVDFGRAKPAYAKSKDRPEGAGLRNPPEVLTTAFSSIQKFPPDVYALGCSFYKLFYGMDYPLLGMFDVRGTTVSAPDEKGVTYQKVQEAYAKLCAESSSLDSLHRTILHMVHPDPSKRMTAQEVFEVLEKETPGAGFEPATN